MLLGLAKIIDSGPIAAGLMAAGLFVFGIALQTTAPSASMLSLLVYILSTAVVCFVVLRHGQTAVVQVLALALLVLFVVSVLVLKAGLVLPTSAFIFWLSGIIVAVVLRRTVDISISTLAAAACGALAVTSLMLFAPGLIEQWQTALQQMVQRLIDSMPAEEQANIQAGQLEKMVKGFGDLLPSVIGLMIMIIAFASVYIARWWQASIVNPGGFQKEFHELGYGKYVAMGGVLLIALAISVGGANAMVFATLAIMCFSIQGLAVAHALVKQRGLNSAWLIGVYIVLLLPQTNLLLAALGISDSFFDLRKYSE